MRSGRCWSRCCPLIRGRGTGGTITGCLDALRAGCDQEQGLAWTLAADATVVRAHQHAAGARHELPKDVPAERLAVAALSAPARTGGRAE